MTQTPDKTTLFPLNGWNRLRVEGRDLYATHPDHGEELCIGSVGQIYSPLSAAEARSYWLAGFVRGAAWGAVHGEGGPGEAHPVTAAVRLWPVQEDAQMPASYPALRVLGRPRPPEVEVSVNGAGVHVTTHPLAGGAWLIRVEVDEFRPLTILTGHRQHTLRLDNFTNYISVTLTHPATPCTLTALPELPDDPLTYTLLLITDAARRMPENE